MYFSWLHLLFCFLWLIFFIHSLPLIQVRVTGGGAKTFPGACGYRVHPGRVYHRHTQTDTHPVTYFTLCIIVGFVYVGNDLSDRLYQTSCFLLFTCSCFLVVSLANRVFLDETQQIRKLHFCTGGEDVSLFYTK